MDEGIRQALNEWLKVELHEQLGPSPETPLVEGGWAGHRTLFESLFRGIDADVAAEIEAETALNRATGVVTIYSRLWPRLSERTIVTLLRAGAVNYIRE
tara:strand:+ start:702 stop:998 length:297 start_codon:yes stop_codon:yes gene_type:complete